MIRLIGIAGSLRRGSFNAALLRAAARLAPADCTVQIESIAGLPLYNADLETENAVPEAVYHLKDAIAGADGLVIATPEYNNGIPGVAKNVIDWLSRPPADSARIFRGRLIAVMGATPGAMATAASQNAWLPVLRSLSATVWAEGRLGIAHAGSLVDASGEISDEKTLEQVRAYMAGFAAEVERTRAARG